MHKQTNISGEASTTLFALEEVSGAAVRGYAGERIGTIDRLLFDRHSGRVAFAIVDVETGIEGDERQVSIPWGKLQFDTENGGFSANVTAEQIEHAPQYGAEEPSRVWERRSLDYFRQPYYWA